MNCSYCGDPLPDENPAHICWLARHVSEQESLEPEPSSEFLDIGHQEADGSLPDRVKRVDLSNY